MMSSQTLAKVIFTVAAVGSLIFVSLVWYASQSVEQKARTGDMEAQYLLALKLIDQSSFQEAQAWIQKSAEQGHVPAQVILGKFHLDGRAGVPDPVRARHWFEMAAHDKHPTALLKLGEIYRDGKGLPADLDQAVSYFQRAADEGSLEAKFNLAGLLISRQSKSRQQGLSMYHSLADAGQIDAMVALADFYAGERQHTKSCDWYEKAADRKHPHSTYKLALCYHDGLGRKKDPNQFFQYISEAAGYGLAEAQLLTGDAYALGIGTEAETSLAIDWYQKAADQSSAKASYKLAKLLLEAGDLAAAEAHLAHSAAQEFAPAQYELALILKERAGADGWEHPAVLFEKAARSGHHQAQYELGQLYASGQGVVLDIHQARFWFGKAAKSGHLDAGTALRELSEPAAMKAH